MSAPQQPLTETVSPTNSPVASAGAGVSQLGPFRILAELGRGGMGAVYRARDTRLNREVALKVLLPKLAADPKAKARFLREARAQAAVEHDHIIPIHEVGVAPNGGAYIVMPLLKGRTLGAELEQNARLPLAEAVRIAREIAEGLAAAHAAGLIHRDIKPANVWLEGDRRRVKILDFGLARAATDAPDGPTTGAGALGDTVNAQLTVTGAVVGTPAYMSPEQARGRAVDHRSDVFSLGALLYELATGQRPFDGPNPAVLLYHVCQSPAVPASALVTDLPPELDVLIGRMLAKNPADRPQTCAEVAAALGAIARAGGVPPLDRPAAPRVPRRAPLRSRWAWVAAAVAALVALAVWAPRPGVSKRTDAPVSPPQELKDQPAVPPRVPQGDVRYQPTKGLRFRPTGDPERDKWAQVRFEGFEFTMNDAPFTFEGFVIAEPAKPADGPYRACLYFWNLAGIAFNEDENGHRWQAEAQDRQSPYPWPPRVKMDTAAVLGRRTHLALVVQRNGMNLFVNGRPSGTRPLTPDAAVFAPPTKQSKQLPREFCLGQKFTGVIEEVRVSKGARYDKTFEPEPLKADRDTLALYPLDATEGTVVVDASGNGKRGTIHGDVTWVRRP